MPRISILYPIKIALFSFYDKKATNELTIAAVLLYYIIVVLSYKLKKDNKGV